jgi:hypothetical protein
MGQNKQRKERFFLEHPTCIYCGSDTPATTQDHWPPRSFFIGRIWPEGFVFPACRKCNAASRIDEMLMAMLCRLSIKNAGLCLPGSDAFNEWKSIAGGVKRVRPEVYDSMLMSIQQKRAELRSGRLLLPAGTLLKDLPVVSLVHPAFPKAVETISRKLFCSLYYHHTKRILTAEARIAVFWRTNTSSWDDFFDETTIRPLLALFGNPRRGNPLHDQFSYAYQIAPFEPPSAVFGVTFNQSIAMLAMVMGDANAFSSMLTNIPTHEILLTPYSWCS